MDQESQFSSATIFLTAQAAAPEVAPEAAPSAPRPHGIDAARSRCAALSREAALCSIAARRAAGAADVSDSVRARAVASADRARALAISGYRACGMPVDPDLLARLTN